MSPYSYRLKQYMLLFEMSLLLTKCRHGDSANNGDSADLGGNADCGDSGYEAETMLHGKTA